MIQAPFPVPSPSVFHLQCRPELPGPAEPRELFQVSRGARQVHSGLLMSWEHCQICPGKAGFSDCLDSFEGDLELWGTESLQCWGVIDVGDKRLGN